MLGLLGITLFFGSMLCASYIETHYSMDATVDYYKNEVCFIDSTGNVWNDDRVNEYTIGDEVRIIFDNNTTDNTRLDDKIIKIK